MTIPVRSAAGGGASRATHTLSPGRTGWSCRVTDAPFTVTRPDRNTCFTRVRFMGASAASSHSRSSASAVGGESSRMAPSLHRLTDAERVGDAVDVVEVRGDHGDLQDPGVVEPD